MAGADFQVNDKVVHPQYGGGYVSGIESIEARGRFAIAIPGGSVATAFLPVLAGADLDWSRLHAFWTDERAGTADGPGLEDKLHGFGSSATRNCRHPKSQIPDGSPGLSGARVLANEPYSRDTKQMNLDEKVTISANGRRNFLKTLGGVGAAMTAAKDIFCIVELPTAIWLHRPKLWNPSVSGREEELP